MESSKRYGKKKSDKREAKVPVGGTVTFAETSKINCGDFESRDVFESLSLNFHNLEDLDETYELCKSFVRGKIRKREKYIRNKTKGFVDFDTKAKMIYKKGE